MFAKLSIELTGKGLLNLSTAANIQLNYFPGKLVQNMTIEGLQLELELIYVSNRSSLISARIINTTNATISIKTNWSGDKLWTGPSLSSDVTGALLTTTNFKAKLTLDHSQAGTFTNTNNGYTFNQTAYHTLKAKDTLKRKALISVCFDQTELNQEISASSAWFLQSDQLLTANKQRWDGYLAKIFNLKINYWQDIKYRRLGVKTIETLMSNWKSAALGLPVEGVFPSFNGFNGFWAWDSWKEAAGITHFNPELAKNTIRSMFAMQEGNGMIPDVIFNAPANNNLRDTKPPLASWAVWEIYKTTGDKTFIQEMYPKLKKYHEWWYSHRDYDNNMLCEYGSTDGTVIAAKWESGMDNAYRFSNSQIVKNGSGEYSLLQESVDLNAYLQQEKILLANMADKLGFPSDAVKFKNDAAILKSKIITIFYDNSTSYFYDLNKQTNTLLKDYGPEGWTPLFTEIAIQSQANSVISTMLSSNHFNTYLPFPTLSVSNSGFSETGYWYGRVWMDQVYFGIHALQKYGYDAEAKTMREKVIANTEGLLSDLPICENYSALNGKMIGDVHFSWSAAHILLMLLESEKLLPTALPADLKKNNDFR
jgi:putative isomerase